MSSSPRGLTLVELMIAIAILGVLTAMSWGVIRGSTEIAAESQARAEISQIGRNAIQTIQRELSLAMISQQQGEYYKTTFKATDRDPTDEIHFVSRAHQKRYANRKESNVAEYAYWSESDLEGGPFRSLMHREARVVDEDPEKGGVVTPLCHSVREFNLRYYDPDKEEWLDEWDTEGVDHPNKLPRAIEIHLELEDAEGRTASFLTRTLVAP